MKIFKPKIKANPKRLASLFVIFLCVLTLNTGEIFAALTPAQTTVLKSGVRYFNTEVDSPRTCGLADGTGVSSAPPSEIQGNNAKIIIGIAKTDNLGQQGALIGLMAALGESGLKNYANDGTFKAKDGSQPYINTKLKDISLALPHEAVGHDNDSVGVFQQRPSTTWSTIATGIAADSNPAVIAQLMTPAYAAEAFFGSPPGTNVPQALKKGLQNIPLGWQTLDPADAVARVQGNAAGALSYASKEAAAQALLRQYWDSSPPIPLPVPFNAPPPVAAGVTDAAASALGNCPAVSLATANAQQLAQQILANKNIQLTGRLVLQDIQAAANGQFGSAGAMTSSAILQLLLAIGKSHTVTISAIQSGGTGHCDNKPKASCPSDAHYNGDGVDFSAMDGKALTGRDAGSIYIINIAGGILPKGSGFGQLSCGPNIFVADGDSQFDDTCNHLHVQVPAGTP